MKDGDGPPGPGHSRSSLAHTRLQWSVGDRSTLEQLKEMAPHQTDYLSFVLNQFCWRGTSKEHFNPTIRNHRGVATHPMQGSKGKENICMQRMWIYIHTVWEMVVSTMRMPKKMKSTPLPRYASKHINKYIALHNE